MFKVNNRKTRARCEICPKLTIKIFDILTLKRFHTPCFSVSIINFEQVNAGWECSCKVDSSENLLKVVFYAMKNLFKFEMPFLEIVHL